jgi:carotenoid 1,2-hydratase
MDDARAPAAAPRVDAPLEFDAPVPAGGYRWWYLDALSEDGAHGLTIIAFVGSVFSPYYAAARRRGAAAAEAHCALNVALYAPRGGPGRWAMTERGAGALTRDAAHFALGPSALRLDGATLTIDIDEVGCPWPARLAGRVRVHLPALGTARFALDGAARHWWRPLAPTVQVEAAFRAPALAWRGTGYLDGNHGSEPLEAAFHGWHWSRAALPGADAATLICYDTVPRSGPPAAIAVRCDAAGRVTAVDDAPPWQPLPATGWRIARAVRSEAGAAVQRTLEDTPFYARSLVTQRWRNAPLSAMHESLSLDRFGARWVQMLLPFRMPRRAGWPAAR